VTTAVVKPSVTTLGFFVSGYESARTTGLYDRRNDQLSLDEVERILL
jgi:hypothetical protein